MADPIIGMFFFRCRPTHTYARLDTHTRILVSGI